MNPHGYTSVGKTHGNTTTHCAGTNDRAFVNIQ